MRLALEGRDSLSDIDKSLLVEILKERGRTELEYGQEISFGTVKLVKRVTGNVSVFFGNK